MKKLRLFTFCAISAFSTAAMAQEPVKVEYFFDTDPGHGQATAISAGLGDNALSLDASGLGCGSHMLHVRAQDSRGLWSPTLTRTLFIYKMRPTAATVVEYFVDEDPGYGKGKTLKVSEGENILALDIEDTGCGAHKLCLRTQDNQGNWSTALSRTFYVYAPREASFTMLEYYFDDEDPGYGKATQVKVPEDWDTAFTFDIPTESLEVGDHHLCVRGKDERGVWSAVSMEPFAVEPSAGINEITLTMPLTMKAANSRCIIECNGSVSRNDCRVEVFGASGTILATTEWASSAPVLSLPVNAARGTVLIIKVKDTQNGRTVIRRLIMK